MVFTASMYGCINGDNSFCGCMNGVYSLIYCIIEWSMFLANFNIIIEKWCNTAPKAVWMVNRLFQCYRNDFGSINGVHSRNHCSKIENNLSNWQCVNRVAKLTIQVKFNKKSPMKNNFHRDGTEFDRLSNGFRVINLPSLS